MLPILVGVAIAVLGGYLWWKHEGSQVLIDKMVFFSIALILTGGVSILYGINQYLEVFKFRTPVLPQVNKVTFWHYLFVLTLIFIGSVSYTLAAYYHLSLRNWSFWMAFAIALPLILIEYQFSIRGNRAAHDILQLSAVQITLITMCFYFINSWVLNAFIIKKPVVWWREIMAFIFVSLAFIFSTAMH